MPSPPLCFCFFPCFHSSSWFLISDACIACSLLMIFFFWIQENWGLFSPLWWKFKETLNCPRSTTLVDYKDANEKDLWYWNRCMGENWFLKFYNFFCPKFHKTLKFLLLNSFTQIHNNSTILGLLNPHNKSQNIYSISQTTRQCKFTSLYYKKISQQNCFFSQQW